MIKKLLVFSIIFGLQLIYADTRADDIGSFTDKTVGDLTAKIHPNSPSSCNVDIIEVGAMDKDSGEFLPQMAFLQDRYDQSYPGFKPKIRTVYSYALPKDGDYVPLPPKDDPLNFVSPKYDRDHVDYQAFYHPSVIMDEASYNISIFFYKFFRGIVDIAYLGWIFTTPVTVVADTFSTEYMQSRLYYRTRALYVLDLLLETKNSSLLSVADEDALWTLLGKGRTFDLSNLLISENMKELVAEYQQNLTRQNRSANFANLLSAINREGLVAYPLFRDFVVVYFDPNKEQPRPLNRAYTDLAASQGGLAVAKNGLVPLGVYALGEQGDRVLNVDLTVPGETAKIAGIKKLDELGSRLNAAFIPTPLNIALKIAHAGFEWLLEKSGNGILRDKIASQAELITLLDSGLLKMDMELSDKIKKEVEDSLFLYQKAQTARYRENRDAMSKFLVTRGGVICQDVADARQKEFRGKFLTAGESFLQWIKDGVASTEAQKFELAESRKAIIEWRTPLIVGRFVLKNYDESRHSSPPEEVIAALKAVGAERDEDDFGLIANIILQTANLQIKASAFDAAGGHASPSLVDSLVSYLDSVDSKIKFSGAVRNTVIHAIQALGQLKYEESRDPGMIYEKANLALFKFTIVSDDQVVKAANQVYMVLAHKAATWEREHRTDFISGGGIAR